MSLTAPQQHRQKVAVLSRHHPASPELVDARRDLAAAKLADYIQRTVSSAPPLTDEQRNRIVSLLRPAPASEGVG